MTTDINFGTRFSLGEQVIVTYGLYRGQTGKVVNYSNYINNGIANDADNRGMKIPNGMYRVKISLLKTIYVNPDDLAEFRPTDIGPW